MEERAREDHTAYDADPYAGWTRPQALIEPTQEMRLDTFFGNMPEEDKAELRRQGQALMQPAVGKLLELKNYLGDIPQDALANRPRFDRQELFTLVEGGAWQDGKFYPLAEDVWQELHAGVIALQDYQPTQRIPRIEPEVKPGDHTTNYQERAIELVRKVVNDRYPLDPRPEFEVYVVWFCKTLQNWKTLLGTTIDDGMYFEVTHNGHAHETYVDIYHKIEQVTEYE